MKLKNFRELVLSSSFLAPLVLITVYVAILIAIRGAVPPSNEILAHLEGLYSRYGYEIIFLGAFLEGALVIDLFIPGASIVLFGAVLSRTGVIEFPLYILSAFAGFSLGFLLDYLIGYLGFSSILTKLGLGKELDRAKLRVKKIGGRAFLLGYFHPDVATVFVTAAGVIKLDIKEFLFYNLIAGSFWLLFWSSIAYYLGESLIDLMRRFFLGFLVIAVLIWLVTRVLLNRSKDVHS